MTPKQVQSILEFYRFMRSVQGRIFPARGDAYTEWLRTMFANALRKQRTIERNSIWVA